jgi:hypothetical protein
MPHLLDPTAGEDVLVGTKMGQIDDLVLEKAMNRSGGSLRWQAPELNDPETDHPVLDSKESNIYAWSCVCYEVCI